jgi:hypothetical protein
MEQDWQLALSLPQLEDFLKQIDASIAALIQLRHATSNMVQAMRGEQQLAELDGTEKTLVKIRNPDGECA